MLKATLCLLLGLSKATSRTYGYDLVATPQPPLEPIAFGAVLDFINWTKVCDGLDPGRIPLPLNKFLGHATDAADCQSKCVANGQGCKVVAFYAAQHVSVQNGHSAGACWGYNLYTGSCEANNSWKTYQVQAYPTFTIDLDAPAKDRFKEPVLHFREGIISTFELYMEQVPQAVHTLFDGISWLWWFSQSEKYAEVEGMVEVLNDPKVTVAKTVLINSLYELESWCTSIIARQADGTIIHSRNLDFDNADSMRKITYNAKFVHGTKPAFEAVMFGGVAGVYTGVKPGAFSISENQREFNKGSIGLVENLGMLFTGHSEISWLLRSTLDQCETYQCAFDMLKDTPIDAFGYIALAGVKEDEGAIISRNRYGAAHVDQLNSTRWFLVQTNSDHWDTVTPGEGCHGRCAAAHENIAKVGHAAMNTTRLRDDVLLQYPNLNHDTIYNSVMTPATGQFDSELVKYVGQAGDEFAEHQYDRPFKLGIQWADMDNDLQTMVSEFALSRFGELSNVLYYGLDE